MDEVFELLKTSKAGLSTLDAEARLKIFGLNKLEEKSVCSSGLDEFLFIYYSLEQVKRVCAVFTSYSFFLDIFKDAA